MAVSIWEMRDLVTKEYDSPGWTNKVRKMPDKQVAAIYHKIIDRRYSQQQKPVKVMELPTWEQTKLYLDENAKAYKEYLNTHPKEVYMTKESNCYDE